MISSQTWRVDKSKSHYETYKFLNSATDLFLNWEAVTLFYAALQTVDEFLIRKEGISCRIHTERDAHVITYLPQISSEYQQLKSLSLKGRYYRPNVQPTERDRAFRLYRSISSFINSQLR